MNIQQIDLRDNGPMGDAQALKHRFDDAMALLHAESFRAAAELMKGFSDLVSAIAAAEVVGTIPEHPEVSIVIVSHSSSTNVERCLEEIARQTSDSRSEVVLVNNGNEALFASGEKIVENFIAVTTPFPFGCAGGRNVGASFSSAPSVMFIDDDGVIGPRCIEFLVNCLKETGAIAARGRVKPLTSPSLTAAHYDLGERRLPRLIDAEGISIWRKEAFGPAGGFDPLLYGHEGIELCSRLWRFYGPGAFLYEPRAVFWHDFSVDPSTANEKKERQARLRRYVDFLRPEVTPILAATQRSSADGRMLYLSSRVIESPPLSEEDGEPVTIVTTARNAAEWIDEYSRSWKAQSQSNFQLVFVDDGSGDGTADRMEEAFRDDERLTLIRKGFTGRGNSLNVALQHARHDLCMIGDADDLSVPTRIARTQGFFRANPDMDCLSFLAFTENNHFLAGPPYTPFVTDLEVRLLFGMPVSFPTFAFRKSRFSERFDEELRGGIDCDWFHRNIVLNQNLRGRIVHHPAVYYRKHDGQITQNHKDAQLVARAAMVRYGFSRVLGALSQEDEKLIAILVDTRRSTSADFKRLGDWLVNFIRTNREKGIYDPDALEFALLDGFDRVDWRAWSPVKPPDPSVEERVSILRTQAEMHIANGRFKDARRALRTALKKQPNNKAVRRRLLAAHRYKIIRMLARSEPYVG